MRCCDGVPGGYQSGHTGNHPALRNTVRKYLSAAKAEGITKDGSAPTDDQLSRLAVIGQSGPRQAETPTEDVLAPWADQIDRWLTGERLQLTRIHELLLGRVCRVSY